MCRLIIEARNLKLQTSGEDGTDVLQAVCTAGVEVVIPMYPLHITIQTGSDSVNCKTCT